MNKSWNNAASLVYESKGLPLTSKETFFNNRKPGLSHHRTVGALAPVSDVVTVGASIATYNTMSLKKSPNCGIENWTSAPNVTEPD